VRSAVVVVVCGRESRQYRRHTSAREVGAMRPTAAACLAAVVVVAFAVDAADLDLVLLHANDMHSRFDETDLHCNECREDDASLGLCYGGFARVSQFVRTERRLANESGLPSLFLVAGDTFQGTPYYSLFHWTPVVDFINQLRPDVMVTIIIINIVHLFYLFNGREVRYNTITLNNKFYIK